MARDDQRLLTDALNLSIKKSFDDVVTRLGWASEAKTVDDKLQHITSAVELLQEVASNLEALQRL